MDFLYSKKRWMSISPCCLLEATVYKNRKAFCVRVFSVSKIYGLNTNTLIELYSAESQYTRKQNTKLIIHSDILTHF